MRREATTPAPRAWTIMLADVVGLMLSFFVLSFSMRELVPIEPSPAPPQVETVAALETPALDQLRALEQERASSPSFAYLAAIIEANSRHAERAGVWHDDTRLVVRLPDTAGSPDIEGRSEVAADAASREVLLALAFLARRFDLDLALDVPGGTTRTIDQSLERAAAIGIWLGETAGIGPTEVTFDRAPAGAGGPAGLVAALQARPAQLPATGATGR